MHILKQYNNGVKLLLKYNVSNKQHIKLINVHINTYTILHIFDTIHYMVHIKK